jgi:hypothetical protein
VETAEGEWEKDEKVMSSAVEAATWREYWRRAGRVGIGGGDEGMGGEMVKRMSVRKPERRSSNGYRGTRWVMKERRRKEGWAFEGTLAERKDWITEKEGLGGETRGQEWARN